MNCKKKKEKKKAQNKGNTEIKYLTTLQNPHTFFRTHAFEAFHSSGSMCYIATEANSNEKDLSLFVACYFVVLRRKKNFTVTCISL